MNATATLPATSGMQEEIMLLQFSVQDICPAFRLTLKKSQPVTKIQIQLQSALFLRNHRGRRLPDGLFPLSLLRLSSLVLFSADDPPVITCLAAGLSGMDLSQQ